MSAGYRAHMARIERSQNSASCVRARVVPAYVFLLAVLTLTVASSFLSRGMCLLKAQLSSISRLTGVLPDDRKEERLHVDFIWRNAFLEGRKTRLAPPPRVPCPSAPVYPVSPPPCTLSLHPSVPCPSAPVYPLNSHGHSRAQS